MNVNGLIYILYNVASQDHSDFSAELKYRRKFVFNNSSTGLFIVEWYAPVYCCVLGLKNCVLLSEVLRARMSYLRCN